jgi:hypothetical protein
MSIHILDLFLFYSMDRLHTLRFELGDVTLEECSSSYLLLGLESRTGAWRERFHELGARFRLSLDLGCACNFYELRSGTRASGANVDV